VGLTAQQMLSEWEMDRPNMEVEVLSGQTAESPRCTSASQAYRQNITHSSPPVTNPHYLYTNKPMDPPPSAEFRYGSGRRSVSDTYSRGPPMYDVATPQHQRPASVRPPVSVAAAGVDAHRLSHMWPTAAPLPAHQHHVSLSHLQHLVNDDFQYGAPPAALTASVAGTPPVGHMTSSSSQNAGGGGEFVRPCQPQQSQQRQHGGSRQQHKTHHKQSISSTNQPVPPASLAAAAAAGYDMFSACRGIQQPPLGYFPHQGAAAALPMGVVGLHHAQMAVAAAANFGQPMPAGQAANSAMYSAAAAAAYNYLNGGGLQPFNVDINSVMRR